MQLSYWNCQGLAQPCRYLLNAQTKHEFELKDYSPAEGEKWFATDKPEMAKLTDFPNLPYLKQEDKVVTQSGAILRYLGRVSGFETTTDDAFGVAETIDGVLSDCWTTFTKLLYNKEGYEEKKKETHEGCMKHLSLLNTHLGKNKFMSGDSPVWVDFRALHIINVLRKWSSEIAALENITRYINAMINDNGDKFKAYFEDQEENSCLIVPGYWAWGAAENMKSLKADF